MSASSIANVFIFICIELWLTYSNLHKNSLAIKKDAALLKIASVKKVVKSKGVAKKWL